MGCGTGEWLTAMRGRGWSVEGVDFDANAVRVACGNGLKVCVGSVQEQCYETGSFDAITLNHVLEHVPDPLDTLRECNRLLRKGGLLYVATPNLRSWGHSLFKQDWRGLEPPRHLQIFTPSALSRLLAEAGFQVSEVKTHSSKYVFDHSYRLYSLSHRIPLAPLFCIKCCLSLINLTEQILLLKLPHIGECIDALSVKSDNR